MSEPVGVPPDPIEGRFAADSMGVAQALDLASFATFRDHPWVDDLARRFRRKDSVLAKQALMRLLRDLRDIDAAFRQKYRRPLFTTIEGRDKKEKSFFRKLYQICQERGRTTGITQNTLIASYETINDLCGARFACPYWDDVLMAVNDVVRPRLGDLGYAVDLRGEHDDKNYLENGSEAGYRSYHFFVRIPTPVNIYGDVEHCLCEMQARTELQNVWAVKSHDLLYKPDSGLDLTDRHVVEDMRQASNHLRAIDQLFMSIRDRARGE